MNASGKGSCGLRRGGGREHEMNGELEVRESSLSYVIGSMNNELNAEIGG